ncbi:hypothetical protein SDC9_42323 [bioreactor metagenome]|jgi:hypothetical protein|uniref:Uncharacterized protein n=1 Tax=bioreactor metagenome TaxID=1076179 RepID=A0A644VXQ3_9ZZZZ
MKNLKFILLVGICALGFNVSAQYITVSIIENTSYSGLYDVKLFVLDVVTQNYCQVAQEQDVTLSYTFIPNEINLSCVYLVNDQKDRYRYIAVVTRQEAIGSGQNWTQLLDTGEMWNVITIPPVQMN